MKLIISKKSLSAFIALLGYVAVCCFPAVAQHLEDPDFSTRIEEVNLNSFFKGMEGAFVLHHVQSGATQVYNPARAKTPFIPASTYKIPNSLIALETGIADGPEFTLPLDSTMVTPGDWWPASWRKEQTLTSAFQNSVFWYYQELARRIGEAQMNAYIRTLDYGNQDIGGGIDLFWLVGDLRISPYEQVEFLKRLYLGQLGVSERSMQIVKNMMVLEEKEAYRLSGKTGTAELTATKELGWLVGFFEREDDTYIYALNMEGERVWEDWPPNKRKHLVLEILEALEWIE